MVIFMFRPDDGRTPRMGTDASNFFDVPAEIYALLNRRWMLDPGSWIKDREVEGILDVRCWKRRYWMLDTGRRWLLDAGSADTSSFNLRERYSVLMISTGFILPAFQEE
jgi:hypothetical protein